VALSKAAPEALQQLADRGHTGAVQRLDAPVRQDHPEEHPHPVLDG
jgi:hypothetical protein